MKKLYPLFYLMLFSNLIYSQYVVKGSIYNPMAEPSQNLTVYLLRETGLQGSIIDSTNQNPFLFEVADTSGLRITAAFEPRNDVNYLYDLDIAKKTMYGINKNAELGITLFGDVDNNNNLNSLDLLRLTRKLVFNDCENKSYDKSSSLLYKIDSDDFLISSNKIDSRVEELNANIEVSYRVESFKDSVSENYFMGGFKSLLTENSSDFIMKTEEPILNVTFSEKELIKNERTNIQFRLTSNLKIVNGFVFIQTEGLDSIVSVLNKFNAIIDGEVIIFHFANSPNKPEVADLLIELEVVPKVNGNTKDLISIYQCPVFATEILAIRDNQLITSSGIELKGDPTLIANGCYFDFPSDTILPSCLELTHYKPEVQACGDLFTFSYVDKLFYDSNGICLYAERKWSANSNFYDTRNHTQIISFLPYNRGFCYANLVWDFGLSGDEIQLADLISKPDSGDYSLDPHLNQSITQLSGVFDTVWTIPSFDLTNNEVCYTVVQVMTCPELSKLAIKPRIYKLRDKTGHVSVFATEFDEGTYNNCDPVSKILIARGNSENFYTNSTSAISSVSFIDYKIKVILESGKYIIVPVQVHVIEEMVDDFVFEIEERVLPGGVPTRIYFSSPDLKNMAGIQCQINLNNASFISDTILGFLPNEFAHNFFYDINDYRFVWISKTPAVRDLSNQYLFALDIVPLRSCKVSDVFRINNMMFETFAVDENLVKRRVSIKFNYVNAQTTATLDEKVLNFKIVNPVRNSRLQILEDLPGLSQVYIYDVAGKLMDQLTCRDLLSGESLSLHRGLSQGLYFIKIVNGNTFRSARLLMME